MKVESWPAERSSPPPCMFSLFTRLWCSPEAKRFKFATSGTDVYYPGVFVFLVVHCKKEKNLFLLIVSEQERGGSGGKTCAGAEKTRAALAISVECIQLFKVGDGKQESALMIKVSSSLLLSFCHRVSGLVPSSCVHGGVCTCRGAYINSVGHSRLLRFSSHPLFPNLIKQ